MDGLGPGLGNFAGYQAWKLVSDGSFPAGHLLRNSLAYGLLTLSVSGFLAVSQGLLLQRSVGRGPAFLWAGFMAGASILAMALPYYLQDFPPFDTFEAYEYPRARALIESAVEGSVIGAITLPALKRLLAAEAELLTK